MYTCPKFENPKEEPLYQRFLEELSLDANTTLDMNTIEKVENRINMINQRPDYNNHMKIQRTALWYCSLFNINKESIEKFFDLLKDDIWRLKMLKLYQLGQIGELELSFEPFQYWQIIDG